MSACAVVRIAKTISGVGVVAMVRSIEAMARKIEATVVRVLPKCTVVRVTTQIRSTVMRRLVELMRGITTKSTVVRVAQASSSSMDTIIVSSANHHLCRTALFLKDEHKVRLVHSQCCEYLND